MYPAPDYRPPLRPVDTGISPLELSWAKARITWVWVLIGAVGLLSIGTYWLLTRHPDYVGQLLLGFLLSQSSQLPQDQRTAADVFQIFVGFVLAWLPFAGLVLHGTNLSQQVAVAPVSLITPLLWQGLVYVGLALMIWRRLMIGLVLASLLFLTDSAVFGYALFKLFQLLWDQYQQYQQLIQTYPDLANVNNSGDLGHWPWILIVPVVIRVALLWLFLTSFGAMRLLGLQRKRLKAARREAQAA
jgi:hypothetical protein